MSNNSFFPTTEAGQIIWLSNYASKLPIHGAACGLGDEETNNTLADIHYYIWLLQHWHLAVKRDAKEATAFKQLMVSGNGTDKAGHPQASTFPDPRPTLKNACSAKSSASRPALPTTRRSAIKLGFVIYFSLSKLNYKP